MNIDTITLGELKSIAAMFSGAGISQYATQHRDHGYAIVIADRGFVYVGRASDADGYTIVRDASVIRYWGTTRGLGELASGGPTDKTKLDPIGEVRIPQRAVMGIVPSEVRLWEL